MISTAIGIFYMLYIYRTGVRYSSPDMCDKPLSENAIKFVQPDFFVIAHVGAALPCAVSPTNTALNAVARNNDHRRAPRIVRSLSLLVLEVFLDYSALVPEQECRIFRYPWTSTRPAEPPWGLISTRGSSRGRRETSWPRTS